MGQLNSMCQHKRDNSRHALKERNDERSDRYLDSEVLDNAEDGVAARVPDVQALVLPLRAPLSDGTISGVEEATAVELALNGDAGRVGRGVPRLAGKGGHVVGACGSDNPHCELKEQNEPQNRSKLLKNNNNNIITCICVNINVIVIMIVIVIVIVIMIMIWIVIVIMTGIGNIIVIIFVIEFVIVI